MSFRLPFLFFTIIVISFTVSAQTTLFSHKDIHLWNGDWHHIRTWTTVTDGQDITEPPVIPQNGDRLIITEGTTVRLNQNVITTGLHIEIRTGATLVIGAHQFTSSLASLTGQGTLVINHHFYPVVSGSHTFAQAGGGTLVYNLGATGSLPTLLTQVNNLQIIKTAASDITLTLAANLSIAGNLSIEKQNPATPTVFAFRMGNNTTVRNLNVTGNLLIGRGAEFRVGNFNAIHNITLGGNLTVDGVLDLTNAPQYQLATNGAAIFTFTGTRNATLAGTGNVLDFYRLILDKGSDQTYELDLLHPHLQFYFPTDQPNAGADPNPVINKALWIRNGTLILREGINIPVLSSGGNNFMIPLNGALWIRGAVVHSTQSPAGTINTGITVIGTLRISAGMLRTNNAMGIVYRGQARIIVEGGEVITSQFRPSLWDGNHQASWIQSGGVVTVDGSGDDATDHPRFSLPLATHSFTMTGGTLNVSNPNSGNRGIVIGSDAGNTNVTGGVVNITVPNDRDFGISLTAPFFQLNVLKSGTTARDLIITSITHDFGTNSAQPLTVLSHLNLQTNARLNANGNNVNIGGNFTLASGARYIAGTNTTRFFWHESHGNNPTTVTISDPALLWPLDLHHLVFDKDMPNNPDAAPGKDINFISPGRATAGDARFLIRTATIGHLTHNVRSSRINLNGYGINARGNITIEDHNAEGAIAWVNTSVLRLGGSTQQQLAVRGWHGLGPNRIILDNTAGTRLLEDADLGNGILEFTNGVLDIGSNLLSTNNPVVVTSGSFSATRMIQTSGLIGDKGVRLILRNVSIAGSTIFTFPIGTPGKFTPMRLTITGTGSFSNHDHHITIKPVNRDHPLVANPNNVLRYYWITEAYVAPGGTISPSLTFDYHFTHHTGDAHNWNGSYRSMLLREGYTVWTEFNTYDRDNRTLTFSGQGFISGDFTAGQNNEFQSGGRSPIFYSRVSGAWNVASTWSTTSHTGAPAGTTPGSTAIVIIAPGHTVTAGGNNRAAQSLRIDRDGISSGVLDLAGTTGHTFPTVLGGGILRLSSGNLPRVAVGNYSNIAPFHFSDGGTIEFYGTTPIDLPTDKFTYNNLLITGTGIKTLPTGTININGQLTIRDRGVLRTSTAGTGTLNLNGLFFFDRTGASDANRNRFLLSREHAWTININGEMRFQEWGEISVATTGSGNPTHTINLTGSITEGRGTMDLWESSTNNANIFVRGGANIDFGTGEHGGTWEFNRLMLEMDNADNTLTIQRHILLRAPTTGANKALELRRGILVLGQRSDAHPNIKDIILSSDTNPFNIPANAGLVVEGSNIVRTTASTNIDLDGLLEFRGNARGLFGYIGTEATSPGAITSHIVYGTGGSARFEVHGNAVVHVSGQVRRSEFTTDGALRYRQTGNSTVVVGTGNPATGSRGVFEVLNTGSEFFLDQNAHLIIAGAADNNQPALLLMPASSQVLGTITLGHAFTGASEQFAIRSAIPLFHMNVHGHNTPVAYIHTLPLLLNGNKSIAAGGRFETSGLGYELKGNLTNNGVFVSQTTETATFSGNQQTVSGTGTTTFNNWRVDAVTGVELNKNILVTNDLNILRGVFRDNGNAVTVRRHLTNNGLHISTTGSGGIILAGTTTQEIRGLGFFGRLELNQVTAGIEAVAMAPLNISNALLMTNGILNIGSHRLTLNENVPITIPSGQSFGLTRMVRTGGGMGDGGIRKHFGTAEVPGDFTFPLGFGTKFTPAIVSLSSFPSGHHITVYNVNGPHPTIIPLAGGDPNRVLQYYWGVETNLGTRNAQATLSFIYENSDVRGTLANYFTAQLQPEQDDTWSKIDGFSDPPTIVPAERKLVFTHLNRNGSVINGFYTAGESTAIPDQVARFRAVNNGAWETPTTWQFGTLPHFGVVIEIPQGISVSITENMKRAYRTIINGHLRVNPNSTFHNLGTVSGSGAIELEGTGSNPINLPAGRFEQFLACGNNSTVIFSGSGGLLPANINTFNNLVITGSGNKTFPTNPNMFICGNLDVNQTAVLVSRPSQVLNITGNLRMENTAQIRANNTDNQIIMGGTLPQELNGNFTGLSSLFRLRSANPTQLTIRGTGVNITDKLYIDQGIIVNSNSVIRLMDPRPEAMANFSQTRFIDGTLTRMLPASSTGQEFVFPVGINRRPGFALLQNFSSPTQSEWTVEYCNRDPGVDGMPRLDFENVPLNVSTVEYWRVDGPSGGLAGVTLFWGPQSLSNTDPLHLVVAEWTPSGWGDRGRSDVGVLPDGFGRVTSNIPISFSQKFMTLASTNMEVPLPIELVSFKARVENNTVVLEWVTASEINNNFFTLERSLDGRNFEVIGYVDSKAPGGNSNQTLRYFHIDRNPPEGILYYRLKQTDYDGAFEYSDIISVQYSSVFATRLQMVLYPNPSDGTGIQVMATGFSYNETTRVFITDIAGRTVYSNELIPDLNGAIFTRIDFQSKLRPGIYIVTVIGTTGKTSNRLVVR
ncbi:MAG TPA: T9SS type A sorting domain-containing protein [Bacteroidales bacterium]|nr:T9SS type A sorting domain-containing protein [Bacteroidales bacterium]